MIGEVTQRLGESGMERPFGLKVPAALRPHYDAFFAADPERMADCFTADACLRDNQHPEGLHGRQAIQLHYQEFFAHAAEFELLRVRFLTLGGDHFSVSELALGHPMIGADRHLLVSGQLYEMDGASGLIRRLSTFIDFDGAVRFERA